MAHRQRLAATVAVVALFLGGCERKLSSDTGFDGVRIASDDRTIELLVYGSGTFEALGVDVRYAAEEIGIKVRLREFEFITLDLAGHCIETQLQEGVAGREIVPDALAFTDEKRPRHIVQSEVRRFEAGGRVTDDCVKVASRPVEDRFPLVRELQLLLEGRQAAE